jgi:hypothetical protein
MGLSTEKATERVNGNDLVNANYILENTTIGDKVEQPQNMVSEFVQILEQLCEIDGNEMPRNYIECVQSSFE